MSAAQIIVQVLIGLFLIFVGAVLKPPLDRLWAWINRPKPLSPADKGKLMEQIAMQELELERLNHFIAHPKDLFLYLYQLAMVALLSFTAGVLSIVYRPADTFPVVMLLVLLPAMICIGGFIEANRMSDKKIDAHKESVKKRIEEARRKLKMDS